ncbi:TolC family protein [Pedobacter frigidisoli]|uniref:TolC family protein n=1 Tax=Pedobacter frigidisoli TaxID=2530455 RepID=UPI00292F48E4|nr:TolC family protein [Pedobacter frigidisoli]
MRYLFKITTLLMLLSFTGAYAQESMLTEVNASDIETYIALAKQNYGKRKVQQALTESAKAGVPMAQVSYLDIFNVSYIYRPEGKSAVDLVNPYNVNGLQAGININIGTLLQKPFMVKKAKAEYKVAQLQELDFDYQLTTEVKRRYYDYLEQKTQLKVVTQRAVDSKGVAESLRSKFERSSVTLDVYNQSRIEQAEVLTLKIQTETNYLKAKAMLEEIIGQKIQEGK